MVAEPQEITYQPALPDTEKDRKSEDVQPLHPILARVSAVIPAYNEARRIESVLSVLQRTDCLSKIIVVDDGSSDGLQTVVEQIAKADERIRLIRHPRNIGKGGALHTGVSVCRADHNAVLMLDADLSCLKPEHIHNLVAPVLDGQADMTLGLFIGGKWNTDFAHRITPWLTGQRCFRLELLDHLDWNAAKGYGLETTLTLTARRLGWRIKDVHLEGVSHPPSEFHHGLLKGPLNRVKMYWQIGRAWWLSKRK